MQSDVRCPSPMRAPHSRHQSATVAPSLRGHVMSLASRAGGRHPLGEAKKDPRKFPLPKVAGFYPTPSVGECSATVHTAVCHAPLMMHRGSLCNSCAAASAVGGREGGGRGETHSESSVPKLGKSSRYFRHVCNHGCVPYPQIIPLLRRSEGTHGEACEVVAVRLDMVKRFVHDEEQHRQSDEHFERKNTK